MIIKPGGKATKSKTWPENATDKPRAMVEAKARAVRDARAVNLGSAPAPGAVADALVGNTGDVALATRAEKQPARARSATAGAAVLPLQTRTLADLYAPLTLPAELVKTRAVRDARAVNLGSAPAPGAVADAPVGNTGDAPLATRAEKQPARARSATAGAAVLPPANPHPRRPLRPAHPAGGHQAFFRVLVAF